MAKTETVIVGYSCDVCGRDDAETYTISYGDGAKATTYELDLCKADAKKVGKAQEALASLLALGRKVGGGRRRSSAGATGARSRSADAGSIRAWAKEQGYEVSDRGRIPADIRDAYNSVKR